MRNRLKYFLIFGISFLLIGSIGMSYAIFTTNTERKGALNIIAGNTYCPLESDDLVDNKITIPAKEEKVIHIKLRNASIIPVYSRLIYEGNEKVEVYRELQSEDKIELDNLGINEERDYRIVIRNYSESEQTITFKGKCGLASKELKLEDPEKEITSDISIPNAPKLTDGLIPVKYDEKNKTWIKADINNPLDNLWYDYDNQMWANAVTVEESGKQTRSYYQAAAPGIEVPMEDINTMWVWIPRYEYDYVNIANYAGGTQTEPGAIGINYIEETKKSYSDPNIYMTHPAFTFGDEELTGFWYGKFETSENSQSCVATDTSVNQYCDLVTLKPQIKPNVTSWRGIRIATAFTVSQKMSNEYKNEYGFSGTEDTHVSKNSEWGSVAYLSQSTYGKWGNDAYKGSDKEVYINNCSKNITGIAGKTPDASQDSVCENTYEKDAGQKASTTGNIYGVYDMNGGTYECTMGILVDEGGKPRSGRNINYNSGFNGKLGDNSSFSNGIDFPNSKYYNIYKTNSTTTACDGICYGHALSETSGWYNDYAGFASTTNPWIGRGGNYESASSGGLFYIGRAYSGGALANTSFRLVLVP